MKSITFTTITFYLAIYGLPWLAAIYFIIKIIAMLQGIAGCGKEW